HVAADAPEAELGEGQEAGEAVDQVQCRRCHREDQRRYADADDVVRRGHQRQGGEGKRCDEGDGELHPTRMPPRLNRPSGRTNSTAIMITKTAASCQMISKKPPIQLSTRPSPMAAT